MTDVPAPAPAPAPAPPPPPAKITIDDFKKVQLRVAKVLEVTNHPNADRLYVVKVDLGTEQRTVCAGIKKWHPDPQVLVGKHVVVVANLQPAMLRGVESNGMILAATGGDDVTVLTPMRDVPPGSTVS
jgi:methionyl-tRNA synthetase